jgi:hypothetical protein
LSGHFWGMGGEEAEEGGDSQEEGEDHGR